MVCSYTWLLWLVLLNEELCLKRILRNLNPVLLLYYINPCGNQSIKVTLFSFMSSYFFQSSISYKIKHLKVNQTLCFQLLSESIMCECKGQHSAYLTIYTGIYGYGQQVQGRTTHKPFITPGHQRHVSIKWLNFAWEINSANKETKGQFHKS